MKTAMLKTQINARVIQVFVLQAELIVKIHTITYKCCSLDLHVVVHVAILIKGTANMLGEDFPC